ncbi:hypothetical protein JX266_010797 [Neoarthrinium moseri]|nr:hypothetical protein JX266_010797 [Neoarthrinium moseri]
MSQLQSMLNSLGHRERQTTIRKQDRLPHYLEKGFRSQPLYRSLDERQKNALLREAVDEGRTTLLVDRSRRPKELSDQLIKDYLNREKHRASSSTAQEANETTSSTTTQQTASGSSTGSTTSPGFGHGILSTLHAPVDPSSSSSRNPGLKYLERSMPGSKTEESVAKVITALHKATGGSCNRPDSGSKMARNEGDEIVDKELPQPSNGGYEGLTACRDSVGLKNHDLSTSRSWASSSDAVAPLKPAKPQSKEQGSSNQGKPKSSSDKDLTMVLWEPSASSSGHRSQQSKISSDHGTDSASFAPALSISTPTRPTQRLRSSLAIRRH